VDIIILEELAFSSVILKMLVFMYMVLQPK
jgi:hypothetical protein